MPPSTSTSSRQQPPSFPSSSTLNRATSTKSSRIHHPPVPNVVTTPPWARDEPPSPKGHQPSVVDVHFATDSRPSDVASFLSSPSTSTSRWWSFTLSRPREPLLKEMETISRSERRGFAGRSMSWLNTATIRDTKKDREKLDDSPNQEAPENRWVPSLIPPSPVAQNNSRYSSGFDSIPWTPQTAGRSSHIRTNAHPPGHDDPAVGDNHKDIGPWRRWGRKVRKFILKNTYVPLLFRFLNITFTTAALAMAIRIRLLEMKFHSMGAVGSSPTVVIIFAPLTLVHVMVAIYLEYFGRPLGLWRTSGKLTHTLSEVLFICAWSAALSLCFDNFFTSTVPCASFAHMAWYNEVPRPPSQFPTFEHSFGDQICDDQLSLICLVGVGLLVYCANLIISLFRIFEKIKYHPAPPLQP
ncbi:hypothetical protein BDN72DRAFT_830164 [Pluteus cervinus]|uniref:Uncharacterized protein n=1 Tax=Pluteus cervinus TaxID=181527 RepID=A0ACD3BFK4_9AGAR|nr:hypothetical protein BDN72DRAFT_830164 [Pluteus cervinus]